MDIKRRILVAVAEATTRSALIDLLDQEGYSVTGEADGGKAFNKLTELAPDLALVDLDLPGLGTTGGIALLRKIHDQDVDVAVVVMAAPGAVDAAVDALRAGASHVLTKPVNPAELSLVVDRALGQRRLRAEADQLRARLTERYRFENMIGSSAPMQAVFKTMSQVATTRASVLLTGEGGTGKELIAAAIHEKSANAKAPFVSLRCAGLAGSVLDGELFGHERGSATDAGARHDGRLAQANGGTLFLDEVGAIPVAIQVKLLRFLQEHCFQRVGGGDSVDVDVRVIAATSLDPRDLHRMVAAGKFHEGLFARLSMISIEVPALRDRPSDVPLLARHLLHRSAAENGKSISGFTDDALERLGGYAWPGNVRELETVIEHAVVLCDGLQITSRELPPHLRSAKAGTAIQIPGSTLDSIERHAITMTLEATGGSTSRAAEILGISIRKVQYKLHEYQNAPRADRDAIADAIGAAIKRN